MQNSFKVGIYTRLSRDDNNGNLESMSIANQREILTQYVQERKWKLVEEYSDDGYSGTNFERPAFRRMIDDAKSGKINCIVTKDLSRLGRNYAMTGYYTDEFFPLNDIRFIAINDGVDTMGDNNDFAAFHNVINEFYPREISKKVRQVKRAHAEKGMFIGSYAPYGYMKAPDNIYQLIIDPESAPIMRRIYEELAMGENARRIAIRLNEEGILSPRAYQYYKKARTNSKKGDTMLWGSTSICNMIKNQVYIGHMVQGQRQVISFKSKQRRLTDPDTWIIVENTHEPIVSKELFDRAQRRDTRIHYCTPKIDRKISVFAGMVRCMDCGTIMCASLRGGGKIRKMTYRCSKYTNSGKAACVSHTIREEVLEKIVLDDLSKYAKLLKNDRSQLAKNVVAELQKNSQQESVYAKKQLDAAQNRIHTLQSTVKNLYMDRQNEKISETLFYSILEDHEKEIRDIEKRLPELEKKAEVEMQHDKNTGKWIETVSKYIGAKKIDREMALALIEVIRVSAQYKVDGKRTQDVEIIYRFVGDLSKLMESPSNCRKQYVGTWLESSQ